jgi:hypothetical protein
VGESGGPAMSILDLSPEHLLYRRAFGAAKTTVGLRGYRRGCEQIMISQPLSGHHRATMFEADL